ncbi:MAG: hypothetical protein WBN96_06520 [Gammaproteobacteria bacterium]
MRTLFKVLVLLLISAAAVAVENADQQVVRLDRDVQSLKKDVLELAAEITRIEQQLLYPSDTHINVFISIAGDDVFELESARLELDNAVIASHLYNPAEIAALFNGGVQRLYTGNLASGKHRLKLFISGRNSAGEAFKQHADYELDKTASAGFIEIQLTAPVAGQQIMSFKDR